MHQGTRARGITITFRGHPPCEWSVREVRRVAAELRLKEAHAVVSREPAGVSVLLETHTNDGSIRVHVEHERADLAVQRALDVLTGEMATVAGDSHRRPTGKGRLTAESASIPIP